MNILIAPDKFKGSLTAQQVCDAVEQGLHIKYPEAVISKFPMADGGNGTSDVLTSLSHGKKINAIARDPLFRWIEAEYGLSADGKTAFIEMATASGLLLLRDDERNPRFTSTVGTGDLILDAIRRGVSTIIIGCGGSATHDVGIGMASALGVKFLDERGNELEPIGENLNRIFSIDSNHMVKGLESINSILITDVDNPLLGDCGAAKVFAPQKGANLKDVEFLEEGTIKFATLIEKQFPNSTQFAGAGAGGGFPVSAKAFLKSELRSGIDFVMNFTKVEEHINQADWIITGEGKFDEQSLHGKVISGTARVCKEYHKKLWVICGACSVSPESWKSMGIERVIALSDFSDDEAFLMENAHSLIVKSLSK